MRNQADLDTTNKSGLNALILCSLSGSSQIAAMLTTLGCKMDAQDKQGTSALMYAAAQGAIAMVVNLIKFGANQDLKDHNGMTALDWARKSGRQEIVRMMESGTLQDVTDILQQMEILKQKNKALEKSMNMMQEMNEELSDRVNATELAKNQIARKLADTMGRMKSSFTAVSPNSSTSPEQPKAVSPKIAFPAINLREKMSGMSAGMKRLGDGFDAMFVSSRPVHQPQGQQHGQQRIQRAQTEYVSSTRTNNQSVSRPRGSSTKSNPPKMSAPRAPINQQHQPTNSAGQ